MSRSQASPDAVALYRAILAHPDEDTPRLVYADWLDEHGEPNRAEFIRAQCRLARLNEWDDGYTADRLRAERLHREHWEEWVSPPGKPRWDERYTATGFRPVRGFPGEVNFTTQITPAEARRWFAPHPISAADVHVTDWRPESSTGLKLWRLESDALPYLRTLRLDLGYGCSPEGRVAACQALAGAEPRSGLTRLEIDGDPTPAGLEAIITSSQLRRLEALSVRGSEVGDDHARMLAEKMNLPALRELALDHGPTLTPDGAQALGRADWFAQLRTLRLGSSGGLGSQELGNLLGKRTLPELRALHLHRCTQFGSVIALAGSRKLPGLIDFYIDDNHPRAEEVLAMAGGPQRFASLSLPSTLLNSPELEKFFARPAVSDLRRLAWAQRLVQNELAALAASPMTRSLRWLELTGGWDGDAAAALLSAEWPHLERLILKAGLSGESLTALFESEKFPRLVSLSAWCWDGRAAFLKRLAKSPATARYRELDVRTQMTSAVTRELADSPQLSEIDRLVVDKGTASPADCKRLAKRFGKRIEITGYYG